MRDVRAKLLRMKHALKHSTVIGLDNRNLRPLMLPCETKQGPLYLVEMPKMCRPRESITRMHEKRNMAVVGSREIDGQSAMVEGTL